MATVTCSAQRRNRVIATDYNECLMGVKDTLGNWVIGPKYEEVEWRHRLQFIVSVQSKYGVVDANGAVLIPMIYDEIMCAHSDYVIRGNSYYQVHLKDKRGIVDGAHRSIVPVVYNEIFLNEDTTFFARKGKRTWHIYHPDGSHFSVPWKTRIRPAVMDRNVYRIVRRRGFLENRHGIINDSGQVILKSRYDGIAPCFTSGIFWVHKNGKTGYCSAAGRFIWPLSFTDEDKFHAYESYDAVSLHAFHPFAYDTVGPITLNGKTGMISVSGDTVLPFIYDDITRYERFSHPKSSVWIVELNGKTGLYETGKGWLMEPQFDYFSPVTSYRTESDSSFVGLYILKKNGLYGARTTSGQEIVPCIFPNYVRSYNGGIFVSRDSAVSMHVTGNSDRLLMINGANPMDKNQRLSLDRPAEINSVPASGMFSVFPARSGARIYYDPARTHDTLYCNDTTYVFSQGEHRYFDYPDTILVGSVLTVTTLKPQSEIRPGVSFYRDRGLVKEETGRYAASFLVHTDKMTKHTVDFVDDSKNDGAHTYRVTGSGVVFREDGKFLCERDQYHHVRILQGDDSTSIHFAVSDGKGSHGILDTTGNFVVPMQHAELGTWNEKYVWINNHTPKQAHRWRLIEHQTGTIVYGKKRASGNQLPLWGNLIVEQTEKQGERLYDVSNQKYLSTQGFNSVEGLNDSGTVFMVRTCSGMLGVLNSKGQFAVDTIWRYYKPVEYAGGRYMLYHSMDYYRRQNYFHYFIFYNDTGSIVFDAINEKIVNDSVTRAKLWAQVIYISDTDLYTGGDRIFFENQVFFEDTPGRDILLIPHRDSARINTWHKRCLYDSIYERRRVWDRRTWSWSRNTYETSCTYCHNKDGSVRHYPLPNDQNHGYTYLLHTVDDSMMSFYVRTNSEQIWFTNAFLFPAGPRNMTLDSLFDPATDWRNFIINQVITYVNSHLYVEGNCHNPAAFPSMLNDRFLIAPEGLKLFPKDFTEGWRPLIITIPWKDVDPFLRIDIRPKLPLAK